MKFKTAEELQAHYAELKLRLYGPRPPVRVALVRPAPPPEPAEPPVAVMKVPPIKEIISMFEPKIMTKTNIPLDQVRIIWGEVLELVCVHTGYDQRGIFARRRDQPLCDARHLLWALAKEHCLHLSLPNIGRLSHPGDGQGRDHTTILHGVRRGALHPKFNMLNKQLHELFEEKKRLAMGAAAVEDDEIDDAVVGAYAGA
jgi:hypothetical protein